LGTHWQEVEAERAKAEVQLVTTKEAYHCRKEGGSGETREGTQELNGGRSVDANYLQQIQD
jgi:hypothetical protein